MQIYVMLDLDPDAEEWVDVEGNEAIDLTMQQKVYVYYSDVTNHAGMVSRHAFLARIDKLDGTGPIDIKDIAGVTYAWPMTAATVGDLNRYGIDLPLELKEQIKRLTGGKDADSPGL